MAQFVDSSLTRTDLTRTDLTRTGRSRPRRTTGTASTPHAETDTAELFRRAADADAPERQRIHNEIVERHLGLADALARRYGRSRSDADDLRQVARVGLVEAAHRFDAEKGDFISFAVPTITGVLKRHFRDHAWLVRPPRSTQELSIRVRDRWPDLAQRLGAEPSTADLAQELADSRDSVAAARAAGVGFAGTALLPNDAGLASGEAQSEFDRAEAKLVVDALMPKLTDQECEILRYRFYFRMSQEEIAMRTGTNQMHVSRQLARLMAKLRGLLGSLEDPIPQ
jgi:RNA polymerase sigma-B factor